MSGLTRDPFCITLAYSIYDADTIEYYLSQDDTRIMTESCMANALSSVFGTKIYTAKDIMHYIEALYSPAGTNFVLAAKYGLVPLLEHYMHTLQATIIYTHGREAIKEATLNHHADAVQFILQEKPELFDTKLLDNVIKADDPNILAIFSDWFSSPNQHIVNHAARYDSVNILDYSLKQMPHISRHLAHMIMITAASNDARRIIRYMLNSERTRPLLNDTTLNSALVSASEGGHVDIIPPLVNAGADILGGAGKEAIHFAKNNNKEDAAALLINLRKRMKQI